MSRAPLSLYWSTDTCAVEKYSSNVLYSSNVSGKQSDFNGFKKEEEVVTIPKPGCVAKEKKKKTQMSTPEDVTYSGPLLISEVDFTFCHKTQRERGWWCRKEGVIQLTLRRFCSHCIPPIRGNGMTAVIQRDRHRNYAR